MNAVLEFKQLPIHPRDKANLLSVRISLFKSEVEGLAERLFTGSISLGQWEETTKSLIKGLHTSAAAIGRGGWDDMTKQDWGRIGAEVKKQYRYLHGFAEDIAANRDTMSMAQLRARAQMYGNAAHHTAIIMQANGLDRLVNRDGSLALPWMPGDGSTDCLVNCKCVWILRVIKEVEDARIVEATWRIRAEVEHCGDCVERNNFVTTIYVPKDIDVPPMIGGI